MGLDVKCQEKRVRYCTNAVMMTGGVSINSSLCFVSPQEAAECRYERVPYARCGTVLAMNCRYSERSSSRRLVRLTKSSEGAFEPL
jgi:hypothetical protein